jgi:hypothetical protein
VAKALLANGLARPIAWGLPFGVKIKNPKAPASNTAGFGSSRSLAKARRLRTLPVIVERQVEAA